MPLKITRASDPITVDRIKMVIYGPPGVAKSSIAFTADNPLSLDFDGGSYRAPNRKDVVEVKVWEDVSTITAADLDGYDTVVMDTAGRALDVLTTAIIAENPKLATGGALSQRGFGVLKSKFIAFLNLLNSFGKDVVLVVHMVEERSGDEVKERLDVQGGSKGEIYKSADAMGRLVIENGQRLLKFSPTDAAFGKNPGQLEPITVPHFTKPDFDGFLGRVIQQTKDKLNELSESQREAAAEQAWFRETLGTVATVEGINDLIGRAKTSGRACAGLLHKRADELKLTFDKASGVYVAPVEAAKEKEAA